MSFIAWLSVAVSIGGAEVSPGAALDRALSMIEPAPALRAAFRATIESDGARRQIVFDPRAAPDQRFRVTSRTGVHEDLDALVADWAGEPQADVRLFADDLRASLGAAVATGGPDGVDVVFRHRISSNDGPIDAAVSSQMTGRVRLDTEGRPLELRYSINAPVRLSDGLTLRTYSQTFGFSHSMRWGVSFVSRYDVEASGGRWGVSQRRSLRVVIDDVALFLAGDARQELASRRAPLSSASANP